MNSNKYYFLTKKFRFESAHRLSKGYVGKCGNIHGHSWNGSITIKCLQLDEYGMGIDYSVIKDEVTKVIEGLFDHKLILWKDDPLVKILRDSGTAVVTMLDNPTSEVIANYIFDWASEKINYTNKEDGLTYFEVDDVVVDETCTSSCKVIKRY